MLTCCAAETTESIQSADRGNTLPGFSERTIAQSATVSTLDIRPSEVTADTVTAHPVQRVTQQDEENELCQML
jgi:hypothetical protein